MKQFKIMLLTGMIMLLTACGGGGDSSNDGTTPVNIKTPQTIAIDKIKAYADDPVQPLPTVKDYADAGVIGVTAENISEINDVVTSLTKEEVDTKEEIQAIADDLDIVLPDTTLPVITLNGTSPMEVTEGETYSDAGATATDDRDGIIEVVTTGSVNTSRVGTYTITYTVTDNAGNTAISSRTVVVVLSEDITAPVITLTGEDTVTVTEGNAYSEEGATAVDERDGTVAVRTEGSVNTSVLGTYIITYTATDSAGNTATEIRTVSVEPITNAIPTANAGENKTIEVNEAVIITGTGSDSDGSVTYEWKKGSTIIGTTATITYTPTVVGTDTLTLTVTDDDGAKDSDSMIVTVIAEAVVPNQVPTADAGTGKTTQIGSSITISGNGTDSDGSIVSYEWKRGNTTLSMSASFTYTPATTGTHMLTLTVTDDDGAKDSDSMIVTVIAEAVVPNQVPTADAGTGKTTQIGSSITISGNGTDSDGSIVSYEWKRGNTTLSMSASFTYTPATTGTHILTLTVTDDDGATDSDNMNVVVSEASEGPVPYDAPSIDPSEKQAFINAINQARSIPQDCGIHGIFSAVPPLTWNDALYKSAYEHSDDMMLSDTFSHTGSGTEFDWTSQVLELGRGSEISERIENNGYLSWVAWSENIAAGYTTLESVINAWIESDGHCKNLMSPNVTEVGMALVEGGGTYGRYWTQNFGTRR